VASIIIIIIIIIIMKLVHTVHKQTEKQTLSCSDVLIAVWCWHVL